MVKLNEYVKKDGTIQYGIRLGGMGDEETVVFDITSDRIYEYGPYIRKLDNVTFKTYKVYGIYHKADGDHEVSLDLSESQFHQLKKIESEIGNLGGIQIKCSRTTFKSGNKGVLIERTGHFQSIINNKLPTEFVAFIPTKQESELKAKYDAFVKANLQAEDNYDNFRMTMLNNGLSDVDRIKQLYEFKLYI